MFNLLHENLAIFVVIFKAPVDHNLSLTKVICKSSYRNKNARTIGIKIKDEFAYEQNFLYSPHLWI